MKLSKQHMSSKSKSIDLCPFETKKLTQDKFKQVSQRGYNPHSKSKLFCHLKNFQNDHYFQKNNFTSEKPKNKHTGKSYSRAKSFRETSHIDITKIKKKSIVSKHGLKSAKKSNGFSFKELNSKSFIFLNKVQKIKDEKRYYSI